MFKDHTDSTIVDYPELLLYIDGGCEPKNPGGVATAGWAIYDRREPSKLLMEEGCIAKIGGPLATNNYGEYAALVFSLTYLSGLEWKGFLDIRADSKLLVEQMNGRWKVKAQHLKRIRDTALDLLDNMGLLLCKSLDASLRMDKFPCTITWIPRAENEKANSLCRLAYQEHLVSRKDSRVQEEAG